MQLVHKFLSTAGELNTGLRTKSNCSWQSETINVALYYLLKETKTLINHAQYSHRNFGTATVRRYSDLSRI